MVWLKPEVNTNCASDRKSAVVLTTLFVILISHCPVWIASGFVGVPNVFRLPAGAKLPTEAAAPVAS